MKRIAWATLVLLCDCYSAGVRVTESQVRKFAPGVTSYADVVKELGEPTTVRVNSDGSRFAIYSFHSAVARPASFIPYARLFAGGSDVKHAMTTFRFGMDGKLLDYSTTDTAIASQVGTTGGRATPRDPEPVPAAVPAPLAVSCSESWALRCNGSRIETCRDNAWRESDVCAAGQACSESPLNCPNGACCH